MCCSIRHRCAAARAVTGLAVRSTSVLTSRLRGFSARYRAKSTTFEWASKRGSVSAMPESYGRGVTDEVRGSGGRGCFPQVRTAENGPVENSPVPVRPVPEFVLVAALLTAVTIGATWPQAARMGSAVNDFGDPLLNS